MEIKTIDDDIVVFFVQAASFPDGVLAAHQKLHSMVPPAAGRRFFGISRPEDNIISYKAAAEELNTNEGSSLGLDTIALKKGNYYCITITDFKKNIPAIGEAFQQILEKTDIDPEGYCVEWYCNDTDVYCMVRKTD